MRKILLSCMIVSAALVGGCKFGHQSATDVQELPSQCFSQQWHRDLRLEGGQKAKALTIRENQLFLQTTDNKFYAMDRRSGDVQFVVDVADPSTDVKAPLVVKDGIVFGAGTTLKFYDKQGHFDRALPVGSPIRSQLVGTDGVIYAGLDRQGGSGRLVAIDPTFQYNAIRWELDTGGVYAAPAKLGQSVFAAGTDGKVYGVTADCAAVWPGLAKGTFDTAGPIFADLKVSGNELFVASGDSKLYCIDIRNGKVRWTYFGGVPLYDSPEVTTKFAYVVVPGKGLCAIARGDGPTARLASWAVANATQFLAEDDKYTYVKLSDNRIAAVDKTDGKIKFESQRTDLTVFVSNPSGSTIYAATKKGLVMAITPVLRPGAVGELVLNAQPTAMYLAMAQ